MPKKSVTPEEATAKNYWPLRIGKGREEFRLRVAKAMRATGRSRSEVVLDIAEEFIGQWVLKRTAGQREAVQFFEKPKKKA